MRGKDLYEKLTDIDDELILITENKEKPKKTIYINLFAAVACFAVIISAYTFLDTDKISSNSELPSLTIDTELSGGMGFEAYMAHDISDLVNANPWREEMKIDALPVIKNKLKYNEMQKVKNPDYKLMEKLLKETAKTLGMEIESLAITNDIPDEETKKIITEKLTIGGGKVPEGYFDISRLFIEDENYKLEVDTSYTVTTEFKLPVKLPNDYDFTNYATYEQSLKVAEYLKQKYATFIGMKNPVINISGGDFNIYEQQSYSIYFYNQSDDVQQNILNYHFNTVQFYGSEEGQLYLARKYYTDLSDIVGEYPIIDTKQALDLLKNGNYITTVPQEFESEKYVKKVELVYRTGRYESLFMPYYKFYVELPNMKHQDKLNSYGAYYVPAVEGQYIKNMPVWVGSFN